MIRPSRLPGNRIVLGMSQLTFSDLLNPWAGDSEAAAVRRANMVANLTTRNCRYILVTDHCTESDAGVTGVPLVGRSALLSNQLPNLTDPPDAVRAQVPVYDPKSSEIWRALNMTNASDMTICLALLPFVVPTSIKLPRQAYTQFSAWTTEIIEWHPQAQVITIGERAGSVLTLLHYPHKPVLPPKRSGPTVIDQVIDIVQPAIV